jgi:putative transposase
MTLIDEFTRECLTIRVARRINSFGVIDTLADVLLINGVPKHIRSDNGAEMTAKVIRSLAGPTGHQNALHRALQSVGERLLRVV